jgi:hypothetical protein
MDADWWENRRSLYTCDRHEERRSNRIARGIAFSKRLRDAIGPAANYRQLGLYADASQLVLGRHSGNGCAHATPQYGAWTGHTNRQRRRLRHHGDNLRNNQQQRPIPSDHAVAEHDHAEGVGDDESYLERDRSLYSEHRTVPAERWDGDVVRVSAREHLIHPRRKTTLSWIADRN